MHVLELYKPLQLSNPKKLASPYIYLSATRHNKTTKNQQNPPASQEKKCCFFGQAQISIVPRIEPQINHLLSFVNKNTS